MSDYKYRFSVVIPIYNVGKYLEETIESVIAQDIGFAQHIQMILVNDGSSDGSEDICLHYQGLYPDNITYVKQENSGVSRARNHGMEYVQGKYVNFLDGDDKWSPDAFMHVWDFFEKKQDRIDLVACPQKFFEAREDNHPLYFKFVEGERVIDVLDKYDYVQLHITASFIKADILTQYKFDEGLKYSEDAKFVGEIILDKLCYGVTNKALHYYRKRSDDSSAVQNKMKNKEWYLITPNLYTRYLMEQSLKKYNMVIPYIQYTFMYDMQFRVREKNLDYLNEEEMKVYHETLHDLLQYVDDDIICKPDKIFAEHRIAILSMKYGQDIRGMMQYCEHGLYFHNIRIFGFNSKSMCVLTQANVSDDTLKLAGYLWTPVMSDVAFSFVSGSKHIAIEGKADDFKAAVCFNEKIIEPYSFEMELPCQSYEVELCYRSTFHENVYIAVEKGASIDSAVKKYLKLEVVPMAYNNTVEDEETTQEPMSADCLVYRGGKLLYANEPVFSLKDRDMLELVDIGVKDSKVVIQGSVKLPMEGLEIEFYALDQKNERIELDSSEGNHFQLSIPVSDKVRSIRIMYCYRKLFVGRLFMESYHNQSRFVIGDRRFEFDRNILKIHPMSRKERIFHTLGIRKG